MNKRDFECSLFIDRAYPDDIKEWPENFRRAAETCARRFADRNGAAIVGSMSYCIGPDHARWPNEGVPAKYNAALIYEVTLDRDVEIADEAA